MRVLFHFGRSVCLILTAVVFACQPVLAQTPQCAGLPDVLAGLERNYDEAIVWQGIWQKAGSPESQLMITAKADGSTWTALIVIDGQACLAGSGTGWTGANILNGESI